MGSKMSKTGVNRAEVPHHLQVWEYPPPPRALIPPIMSIQQHIDGDQMGNLKIISHIIFRPYIW